MTTVCFDLRCLQMGHESRGVGMHAISMLERLQPLENVKYVFYAFSGSDPIKTNSISIPVAYKLVTTPDIKRSIDRPQDFFHVARIIWHQYKPLIPYGVDVFVQFDFMLGLPRFRNMKKVLIAYDLIPLLFPNDYLPTPFYAYRNAKGIKNKIKKPIRAAYYRFRYWLHYKEFGRADINLSISKSTAQSLIQHLNISSTKIVTIPLAPVFSSRSPKKIPRLSNLSKPFFFYIGGTDSRKQVQDLVDAYSQLRVAGDNVALVLAGKEFDGVKDIPSEIIRQSVTSSPYTQDIHCIGYVSNDQKLWLYKNAIAFVYPTLYEGFGLPIVEAMQSGCPAISYNNSSIPEVAGKAAILVENGDVEQLASAMHDLSSDSEHRRQHIQYGVTQASTFSWEHYMQKFYETVL